MLALLAMAAVVLLPSEAWAVTGPSADYRCSSYVSCW
ncbi:MAG: hypothetical protein JWO22_2028, partial [Frankiales bacterium]|nr:hypothetical protein [Frankiales bacterium]